MGIEFFSAGYTQVIDLRPGHVEELMTKVFDAFNLACDLHDIEAAQDILQSARSIMGRSGLPADADRDRSAQLMVDAHYRLWELRYLVR